MNELTKAPQLIAVFRWRQTFHVKGTQMTKANDPRDGMASVAESEGPSLVGEAATAQYPEANEMHEQNSTTFQFTQSAPSKTRSKRCVDEGVYNARCIDVRITWNNHRQRHDAELDFDLLGINPRLTECCSLELG